MLFRSEVMLLQIILELRELELQITEVMEVLVETPMEMEQMDIITVEGVVDQEEEIQERQQ